MDDRLAGEAAKGKNKAESAPLLANNEGVVDSNVQDAKRETEHPRCKDIVQLPQGPLVSGLEAPHQRALCLLTKTF